MLIQLTVSSRNSVYEGRKVAIRPEHVIDLSPYFSTEMPTAKTLISMLNGNTYTVQETVDDILEMMGDAGAETRGRG